MKIENTLVDERYIYQAIQGARLSWGSNARSDSYLHQRDRYSEQLGEWFDLGLEIGPEDEKLIRKLVSAGGGEDKLLRTIPVSTVITAPLRFWVDLDTYKVGTVKQSSSLMHYVRRRGIPMQSDFSETTDPRLVALAKEKFYAWVEAGAKRNHTSKEWLEFQDAIGRGYLYAAQWFASYAVLRTVYFQRRYHRQGEFRELCAWIEDLPHSWMITMEKADGKAKD